MAEVSYIKEHDPAMYSFFKEYWGFLKQYWVRQQDAEWWDCFLADLELLVNKYDKSDFYVDLLMQLYKQHRANASGTDIATLQEFLKEWWGFVNRYYPEEKNQQPDWWECFLRDNNDLTKKYEDTEFFTETIYIFVQHKTKSMPDLSQIAAEREEAGEYVA